MDVHACGCSCIQLHLPAAANRTALQHQPASLCRAGPQPSLALGALLMPLSLPVTLVVCCVRAILLLASCSLKMDGPYDSRLLPVLLCTALTVSMTVVFSGAIARMVSGE